MVTCKRCNGEAVGWGGFEAWRTMKPRDVPCPDCKGTGEVEDDDERDGDNTNKGGLDDPNL